MGDQGVKLLIALSFAFLIVNVFAAISFAGCTKDSECPEHDIPYSGCTNGVLTSYLDILKYTCSSGSCVVSNRNTLTQGTENCECGCSSSDACRTCDSCSSCQSGSCKHTCGTNGMGTDTSCGCSKTAGSCEDCTKKNGWEIDESSCHSTCAGTTFCNRNCTELYYEYTCINKGGSAEKCDKKNVAAPAGKEDTGKTSRTKCEVDTWDCKSKGTGTNANAGTCGCNDQGCINCLDCQYCANDQTHTCTNYCTNSDTNCGCTTCANCDAKDTKGQTPNFYYPVGNPVPGCTAGGKACSGIYTKENRDYYCSSKNCNSYNVLGTIYECGTQEVDCGSVGCDSSTGRCKLPAGCTWQFKFCSGNGITCQDGWGWYVQVCNGQEQANSGKCQPAGDHPECKQGAKLDCLSSGKYCCTPNQVTSVAVGYECSGGLSCSNNPCCASVSEGQTCTCSPSCYCTATGGNVPTGFQCTANQVYTCAQSCGSGGATCGTNPPSGYARTSAGQAGDNWCVHYMGQPYCFCASSSYCGDGTCNNGETSTTCPHDCPGGSTYCNPSGCPAGYQDIATCANSNPSTTNFNWVSYPAAGTCSAGTCYCGSQKSGGSSSCTGSCRAYPCGVENAGEVSASGTCPGGSSGSYCCSSSGGSSSCTGHCEMLSCSIYGENVAFGTCPGGTAGSYCCSSGGSSNPGGSVPCSSAGAYIGSPCTQDCQCAGVCTFGGGTCSQCVGGHCGCGTGAACNVPSTPSTPGSSSGKICYSSANCINAQFCCIKVNGGYPGVCCASQADCDIHTGTCKSGGTPSTPGTPSSPGACTITVDQTCTCAAGCTCEGVPIPNGNSCVTECGNCVDNGNTIPAGACVIYNGVYTGDRCVCISGKPALGHDPSCVSGSPGNSNTAERVIPQGRICRSEVCPGAYHWAIKGGNPATFYCVADDGQSETEVGTLTCGISDCGTVNGKTNFDITGNPDCTNLNCICPASYMMSFGSLRYYSTATALRYNVDGCNNGLLIAANREGTPISEFVKIISLSAEANGSLGSLNTGKIKLIDVCFDPFNKTESEMVISSKDGLYCSAECKVNGTCVCVLYNCTGGMVLFKNKIGSSFSYLDNLPLYFADSDYFGMEFTPRSAGEVSVTAICFGTTVTKSDKSIYIN